MKQALVIFGCVILLGFTSIYCPIRTYSPLSGSGASYRVYTALISQSGTSEPTATILENTLGFTPTWSYFADGSYLINHTGGFPADKTFVYINSVTDNAVNDATIQSAQGDFVQISLVEGNSGLLNTSLEIRVYP